MVLYDNLFLFQNDFTSADFETMPASLTYKMFKTKSQFPLHTAIRTKRDDVVFLYLVENDAQVNAFFCQVKVKVRNGSVSWENSNGVLDFVIV